MQFWVFNGIRTHALLACNTDVFGGLAMDIECLAAIVDRQNVEGVGEWKISLHPTVWVSFFHSHRPSPISHE